MKKIVMAGWAVGLLLAPVVAAAQISDGVVKLGVLTDMSNSAADATGPGSVLAAQMAVADFGGTVLGAPIEVIWADHQIKPDIGAGIARQWYDQEKVDAIVDVPVSSVALAVQEITREKNRVLLMSGPGSSDLTGKACSPNGVHWTYDTYALSHVAAKAMVERGEDSWFFITADYAFGNALERDAAAVVTAAGGKVLGDAKHPINTADMSSLLLKAQASGAKVIALANATADTQTSVKQAAEYGLQANGQKLLALLIMSSEVKGIGLPVAQGMIQADAFYWDRDDETRAWAKRFFDKAHRMPTMLQAGVYSEVLHYLKAIAAAGTDEAKAVIAKMRELPVNDFFAHNGHLREDGRMVHDMYLLQVKSPAESKGEWDLYKLLATIPGDQAFRPMDQGGCPLVTGK